MNLPNNGFWYQPASLWSIGYVDASANVASVRFNFKREHFRNPTRHPITLNRFAICGVNYPFTIQNIPATAQPSSAESAMFNKARIRIAAPYRRGYSRDEIPLASYSPRSTGWMSGNTLSDSSLFGVNYLRFDKPILLPRKSALEVALTGMVRMSTTWGAPFVFSNAARNGRFFFHESGGLFSGSSRQKGLTVHQGGNIAPIPDPYSGIPYSIPPDYAIAAEAGINPILWPPQSQMNARDYEQQEGTRSGSTETYGMGVFIDQIDWDDAAKASVLATEGTAAGPLYQISMNASMLGCRARAKHAPGPNDWWWRPGAPLSLVLDTITSALVYDLPEPITLSEGETLDVTMVVDAAATAGAASGYQVGISFNGWTAIEG